MTRTWLVDAPSRQHLLPASAVAQLLDAPQAGQPAKRMLQGLNEVAPVDYLSLVSYGRPQGGAAPILVEGHAQQAEARDVTAECFAIYRQQYWRSDEATAIAGQLHEAANPVGAVTALHFHPGDVPVAAWRREIYEREQLCDRLSFLYSPRPHAVYAINLYRRAPHGPFGAGEVQSLLGLAPLLRQAHQAALLQTSPIQGSKGLPARLQRAQSALETIAPALSPRELQVAARIACGTSADGIAAELDVAPSTVVTLRRRAYLKLAEAGLAGGRLALLRLAA
jgi:DNA-binding CsgD family transcriptional regulator